MEEELGEAASSVALALKEIRPRGREAGAS